MITKSPLNKKRDWALIPDFIQIKWELQITIQVFYLTEILQIS